MTAMRRMTRKALKGALAGAAILIVSPALAQNADAPIDVTAAPARTDDTVGPSQLQNFSLNGTVTRPAAPSATTATTTTTQRPAAPPPAPAAETATAGSGTPAARRPSSTQAPAAAAPDPGPSLTQSAGPAPASTDMVTPSTPSQVTTGTSTRVEPAPTADSAELPTGSGSAMWPWLAALLALAGGGAFLAYSRRNRRERYGDAGRMAFAGLAPDLEPGAAPVPPVRPRADPVPPRAQPRPDPVPPRAQPEPPKAGPSDGGLIVSTRLKPSISLEFHPDRAVVTDRDVLIQFDVIVHNNGSAPARDVLVEARMVGANAEQDREIGLFFQNPVGQGDRIAGIPPLGRIALKSAVRLPLDQLPSFQLEGRRLFVPLVAFNVLFNGDAQASASFLVGRGNDGDEKLAPFRLDLGPRIFRGLSARPHSMGLSR